MVFTKITINDAINRDADGSFAQCGHSGYHLMPAVLGIERHLSRSITEPLPVKPGVILIAVPFNNDCDATSRGEFYLKFVEGRRRFHTASSTWASVASS